MGICRDSKRIILIDMDENMESIQGAIEKAKEYFYPHTHVQLGINKVAGGRQNYHKH